MIPRICIALHSYVCKRLHQRALLVYKEDEVRPTAAGLVGSGEMERISHIALRWMDDYRHADTGQVLGPARGPVLTILPSFESNYDDDSSTLVLVNRAVLFLCVN